jgi:hypothetical protein
MNLSKFFNQTAVYWGSPIPDGWGGFTYADPVEMAVRWSDMQEKFVSGSPDGSIEELLSRSVILSETDFEVNGRMYLGSLVDLDSTSTADDMGALTIKSVAKIPTIKADQFLRKAWLN